MKASDDEGATEPDEGVPDELEAATCTDGRVVVVDAVAHTVVLVVVVEAGTVVLVVVVEVLALVAEAGTVVLALVVEAGTVVLVVVVEAGTVVLVVVVEAGTVVLVVVVVGVAPVAHGVVLVVVVVEEGTAKVVVVLGVVVVEVEVEVVAESTFAVQHGRSSEMQVLELVEAVQLIEVCDGAAVAPASPAVAITREASNSPAPRLNLDSRPGHRRIQRSFPRSVSAPAGAPGSTSTRPRLRTVGPHG